MNTRTWSIVLCLVTATTVRADYTNFEVSQVHPLTLTPSGGRLLAVNTPDAVLEVFRVTAAGGLVPERAVPVGLEPVSVACRDDREAWVVNELSDSVSIVDLDQGVVTRTLRVGEAPSDVVFTAGRAFVAIGGEDEIEVFDLANLAAPPAEVPLFSRRPRALAVSRDGSSVHAVTLWSGNQTTIISAGTIFRGGFGLLMDPARLATLGVNDFTCNNFVVPNPYPPLPPGITRNPALTDPANGVPEVGLIVQWNEAAGRWEDDAGQDWSDCVDVRLPDHDLFTIDATTLAVTEVDHLGTNLFEVSVNPATGKVYVPHTDARNHVRFEHALGVRGHVVDNRMAIVDPAAGNAVTQVDLNGHVDRASTPPGNLAEREASISQPGMMTWRSDGSVGYLTAIGSRKLFRIDGTCELPACIFGANRAAPAAVEVGHGPTGVALHEGTRRLFVLNRIDNTIAIVDEPSFTKVGELPLHDVVSDTVREGRIALYDGMTTSQHGDASCASCHVSGHVDGLSWDLGNPEGDFVPYTAPSDNVRFVDDVGNPCPPANCANHQGFDPQKGPMATQTLRGMLEPLHWRGDRATMNDFNPAFVGLLGAADVGPVNGQPAGLDAVAMETFRQFALGITFPPNPYRPLDDTLPDVDVPIPETNHVGNPTSGLDIFDNQLVDAGFSTCRDCHARPFGAKGGRIGGVAPTNPTSLDAAALMNGDNNASYHSDLKIAHLRNVYEKIGPDHGDHAGAPPDSKSGFGFLHDGSAPSLLVYLSNSQFFLGAQDTAREVRDVASFVMHYDTGTKPCTGMQVTVPAGTPPTGSASEEQALTTLLAIGDASDARRHGELVAVAPFAGQRHHFRWDSGQWVSDRSGEFPFTTVQLREAAAGPVTFTCVPVGSGVRLGGDRDEDGHLNRDDCAPAEPSAWLPVGAEVTGLRVSGAPDTRVEWSAVAGGPGVGTIAYELLGGLLSELHSAGLATATGCVTGELPGTSHVDSRPLPSGDGFYYLARPRNACGAGGAGSGRSLDPVLDCRGLP